MHMSAYMRFISAHVFYAEFYKFYCNCQLFYNYIIFNRRLVLTLCNYSCILVLPP